MKKIPLAEFVSQHNQTGAAEKLGCTQPAIRKALLNDRTIYVIEHDDGSFSAEELKPFPSQSTDKIAV